MSPAGESPTATPPEPWSQPRPAWAFPALALIALLAAGLTTWRGANSLEIYYAAAVRSMSMSWHNFFFAAFDPAATVSLDKLPGAFWVQALSVRLFGVHAWAIVLPQVIEGVLSVLVLYRVVRRLTGPVAGLLAALMLAVSPATVTLNRGNISDSLMILLVLLAANAAVSAATAGGWGHAAMAGVWVGLAFQTKMIEAWIILPALGIVILLAAGRGWLWRTALVAVMGVVGTAVSLSYLLAVTLTPAASRPYVDGSHHNSIFQQVFVYNGFGRIDQVSPNQLLTQSIGLRLTTSPAASWHRLLTGGLGRDTGWLIPAALLLLVTGLVATRRAPRRDRTRASFVLWGSWLVLFAVTFSFSASINSYYTAALSPAIAGILASGAVVLWRERATMWAGLVALATVGVTAAYAWWLLPAHGTGLSGWLRPAMVAVGAVALAATVLTLARRERTTRTWSQLAAVSTGMALLLVPVTASVSIATSRLGPFDTPFEPPQFALGVRTLTGVATGAARQVAALERYRGTTALMATETSAVASPFIFDSGQEVLPIGGFTGTIPEPSLSRIESLVHTGVFHLVLQSPMATDPRFEWIAGHCLKAPSAGRAGASNGVRIAIYYCLRTS